ncbi:helix-turn-helix transcriptional regulator [Mucilaginibacter ginsenosidivorans]|uniref:YafY family transcriptional regulator n=1 Tax=Mucilaginibacter ginsenosidivorans TaxID=398053 RepID=A0A5B8UYH0_9SPHI|nr:YafY family protein [Mucilaginibacter ginsenosidivorans]QEC63968.1 YafY family transcriptional regulator [Mucilaginibacter ginsenosidivorans]
MNRIDRISAILIHLQSRRVVKASDIADRFNISLRTVYRDVKTLEEAGIPLIGEAGVGYSIMDGYRLPPVMFTREEATAFLTAEKLMEKLTDPSSDENYKSAMYKIRSVLRMAEKDFLDNIDGHIEVLKSRRTSGVKLDLNPLQIILKGIGERTVLSIHYFAMHNQQWSERCIEPVGVFYQDNYWHLIAWCRLREDYRDFRLDRISNISLTGERFKTMHPNLNEYISQQARERNLEEVIIRVEKSIGPYLNEQKYYNGFVSEREVDGLIEMTFLTGFVEGFVRWLMMYGDMAIIVSPDSLKEKVKELSNVIMLRNS